MNDYEEVTVVSGEDMNTYTDSSGSTLISIDLLASLNSRVVFESHTHILKMFGLVREDVL